jgi:hypothetical protein
MFPINILVWQRQSTTVLIQFQNMYEIMFHSFKIIIDITVLALCDVMK